MELMGIKGRLQTRVIELPEGNKKRKTEIIAEKVTFLTSNSARKNDNLKEEEKEEECE